MAMSKKKLTLSIVLCALLAGGVLGASLPAAIGTAQQTVKRLITDPGEGFAMPQEVRYDTERGTTVHALDPHPSYIFNPAGGSLKEDAQFEVWDIASQGEYAFEGMFRGSGRIYSGVAFTGKDSYTITISCDGTPGALVLCSVFNASDGSFVQDGMLSVERGETDSITITGLSPDEEIYLMLGGIWRNPNTVTVWGSIR